MVDKVTDYTPQQTNLTDLVENAVDYILQQTNLNFTLKNITEDTLQQTNLAYIVKNVTDDNLQQTNLTYVIENVTDESLLQTNLSYVVENVSDHTQRQTNLTYSIENVMDESPQQSNHTDIAENVTVDDLQQTNLTYVVENVTNDSRQQTNLTDIIQQHSDVAHAVRNDMESTLQQKTKTEYLLYVSQAGFANQRMFCLQHASMVARTLNRVLLSPTVLPHPADQGGVASFFVINSTNHEFPKAERLQDMDSLTKKLLDPLYLYLERLDPNLYLPLDHVLDLNLTLPGIQTMDVREFYEDVYQQQASNMTRATIEIDYGYSNLNTIWIHNNTKLEARPMETIHRTMYGKSHILNVTYRDIVKTLAGKRLSSSPSMSSSSSRGLQTVVEQEEGPDIFVFLDAFETQIDSSLFKTAPRWAPTMTPSLRQTVHDAVIVSNHHDHTTTHYDESDWLPVYAAVHIRGGDGVFVSASGDTIRKVFKGISAGILKWLNGNSQFVAKAGSRPTIGLYVATDIKNIQDNLLFKIEAWRLKNLLKRVHDVNLMFFYKENSMGAVAGEQTDPETNRTVTSILGGILYGDLFWDIQVCACAPIGFFGSGRPFSSFSKLIGLHRLSDHRC